MYHACQIAAIPVTLLLPAGNKVTLMSTTLILKLFLVPLLIWAVTLAGRKWGPAVAGWLSAFPIVSGPILLIISLERGSAFAAHAAGATLLAVLAMMVFSLSYAWASARFRVAGSMLCGLCAWALAVQLGVKYAMTRK
jgi:hypothetical protein